MAASGDRLDDVQIETYRALMGVAGQLRFRLERHLKAESDLSLVQFELLGRLMQVTDHRLRMTDLADEFAVTRSAITYQVSVLVERAYVKRVPSPDDERSTMVELTDAGHRAFLGVLPGHVEIVRALLFDALLERDAQDLGRVLTGLRDHTRALPPRSAERRAGGRNSAP